MSFCLVFASPISTDRYTPSPPSKTGIVAALTIPALYHRHQECIDTYMSFAYMNLRMYEMVYERMSMKCFLRIRDWVMELLKDP